MHTYGFALSLPKFAVGLAMRMHFYRDFCFGQRSALEMGCSVAIDLVGRKLTCTEKAVWLCDKSKIEQP